MGYLLECILWGIFTNISLAFFLFFLDSPYQKKQKEILTSRYLWASQNAESSNVRWNAATLIAAGNSSTATYGNIILIIILLQLQLQQAEVSTTIPYKSELLTTNKQLSTALKTIFLKKKLKEQTTGIVMHERCSRHCHNKNASYLNREIWD